MLKDSSLPLSSRDVDQLADCYTHMFNFGTSEKQRLEHLSALNFVRYATLNGLPLDVKIKHINSTVWQELVDTALYEFKERLFCDPEVVASRVLFESEINFSN